MPRKTHPGKLAKKFKILHGNQHAGIYFTMRKVTQHHFNVVIERDEEGYYVGSVPELVGCHTQVRSLDKLMERAREAIELCLEVERDVASTTEFIGIQHLAV